MRARCIVYYQSEEDKSERMKWCSNVCDLNAMPSGQNS